MFSGGLKLSDDEDDEFGVERKDISNLSNIFGVTIENPLNAETPSLRYVSPKQTKPPTNASVPTTNDTSTDGANDWKVQVAKVVTAYKLLNQENIYQGKIGLAILKNVNENRLRLILYRSKNNVLSTLTFKDDTNIYRNNLYLQFNDDLQLFWSLLFETQDYDDVLELIGDYVKRSEVKDTKQEENVQPKLNEEQPTTQTHSNPTIDENSSDDRLRETKATLLKRMAKMGQPLPKLQATTVTTTDVSDSSDTEAKVKVIQKPIVASRKPKIQTLVSASSSNSNMQMVPASTAIGYGGYNTQGLTNSSSLAVATDSQYMNILLAENRTQNSELRMNISKLETKIERVMDKIDILSVKGGNEKRDDKEDEILTLEEKILELKKENRGLRARVKELTDTSSCPAVANPVQEEDYSDVSAILGRFGIDPKTNLQPIDVYKQLVQCLNNEQAALSQSLSESQNSLDKSKTEISTLTAKFSELEKILTDTKINHKTDIDVVNSKLDDAEHRNDELSKRIVELGVETEQMVKDIMNSLYQKLSEQFEMKDSFTSKEVTRLCAQAIKTETNNVIKRK